MQRCESRRSDAVERVFAQARTPYTLAMGGSVNTLSDELHDEIKRLCASGDELAEAGHYPEALDKYWAAWDVLPEPRKHWDAALWVLTAIGDANFHDGDFEAGRDNLSLAMQCPEALGNPFIHLRLGQCQLELGNLDRAADELMRAYMGAGAEIFEDQDDKYIRFLQTRAKDVKAPERKSKPKRWFWQ
jgi:tetratricopeptide (TPR) repeat protein